MLKCEVTFPDHCFNLCAGCNTLRHHTKCGNPLLNRRNLSDFVVNKYFTNLHIKKCCLFILYSKRDINRTCVVLFGPDRWDVVLVLEILVRHFRVFAENRRVPIFGTSTKKCLAPEIPLVLDNFAYFPEHQTQLTNLTKKVVRRTFGLRTQGSQKVRFQGRLREPFQL